MSASILVGVRTPLDNRVLFVTTELADLAPGEWVRVDVDGRTLPARIAIAPGQLLTGNPEPAGSVPDRMSEPDPDEIQQLAAEMDDPHQLGRVGAPRFRDSVSEREFWSEIEHTIGRIGQRVEIDGRAGVVAQLNVLEGMATVRLDDGDEIEVSRDILKILTVDREKK